MSTHVYRVYGISNSGHKVPLLAIPGSASVAFKGGGHSAIRGNAWLT